MKRISEQESYIVRLLPRVAGDPNQLKAIAQSVYDAIRAFLLLENHPIASKERACEYFCTAYPRFSEAAAIYAAYLDPGSVVEVASFIFDALALVKHLRHRALQYPLRREVVLVNTPSSITPHPRDDYLSFDHNMPLGLLCLAAYLRAQNVTVRILDAYAENLGALSTVDRLVSDGSCPQVVGLNVSSPNVHIAHTIAAYLKRICGDVAGLRLST